MEFNILAIRKNRKYYLSTGVLILLGLILRLWGIQRPYWADEIITIKTLNATILKNPFFFGYTTNLPFFFYLLRIWNLFFEPGNIIAFRFLPIILNLINLYLLFWFIHKYFGSSAAIIVSLLFIFSPLQIYYAQELRPYSLVQLLLFSQFIFLNSYINNSKKKIYLYIHLGLVLLAFLTHYSAFLFYFGQMLIVYLYLYIKRERLDKNLITTTITATLATILIYLIMNKNPQFETSVQNLNLSPNFNLVKGLIKIKEVISFYYFFGLKYYFVSPLIQSIFKKSMIFLFIFGGFTAFKEKNEVLLGISGMLLISLLMALTLEFLALYPFGGRHIMAYAPFSYILVAKGLSTLIKRSKVFVIVFLSMLMVFSFHQFVVTDCIYAKAERTTHSKTYEQCFKALKSNFSPY